MFDTIFAPLTIKGKCGLIVVRISGERVDECLEKMGINRKKLKDRGAVLTKIFYRKKILDLGLVLYFKAPRSFTGEDVAELNLHCSDYIVRKVYEMLLEIDGVRLARNGEFSKRAFLNGKMDLVEAESIGDLVNSETELQHGQAIKQLFGKTSEFFESLRNDVLDIQAEVEVMIDFPEDNVGEDFTILEKKVKN
ncbi:MAG: tRNA uridine-5-carboxymethylaminomethyl(34) synthesis GTPase MnmE, partial [Rickettsiales bacterium]|nr:tRNA uridine-5-carboxymethylaminomethyl(34) synthesis GTPase MnmE [Rickettsiales bacterium]